MSFNRQIVLAARPNGFPTLDNFRLVETPIPSPAEGQVLVRNHYLSLDPYMRGRMDDAKSYATPVALGEVMVGGTVGQVIASKHSDYAVGEYVSASLGWQECALSDGVGVRKIEPERAPLSAYLGVLGMPGVTAWIGLIDLAQTQAGRNSRG